MREAKKNNPRLPLHVMDDMFKKREVLIMNLWLESK